MPALGTHFGRYALLERGPETVPAKIAYRHMLVFHATRNCLANRTVREPFLN